MTRRLILPAALLIAVAVGYLRVVSRERAPVGTYQELVKATQPPGPTRDGGSGLACAARFTAPPPRPASDASVPEVSLQDFERRQAELDGWPLELLLADAGPGELDAAVLRRLLQKTVRTAGEDRLLLHFELEGEVLNGGFHQFFFNSSGDRALETRAVVAELGPKELLAIYDCALTAFPDGKPSPDRDARNAQLAAWGGAQFEVFDALDRAVADLADLSAAREHYIRTQLTR